MPTTDDRERRLDRIMAAQAYSGDALIEVLHAAQQLYGYLSHPLLADIARKLKLPPSRVLGVATFYHLFQFEPDHAHRATVCLGTACYAAGGDVLMERMQRHCRDHADEWSLHAGRCVGSCGLAPVVICDGENLSRVTPQSLEQRLTEIAVP